MALAPDEGRLDYALPMPRLRTIRAAMGRRRRLTATLGVLLVLGVVVMNAHAALPEHHHHHGEETICGAALSLAVAAAAIWLWRRKPLLTPWVFERPSLPRMVPQLAWVDRLCDTGDARAGPVGLLVLRR
jgi:hypothetical protein